MIVVCLTTFLLYATFPFPSDSKSVKIQPNLDRQAKRETDTQKKQRYTPTDRETDRETDRQRDRQRDRQTDRQMDGQTDGQI